MSLGILAPATLGVVILFWAAWGLGIWAIVHAARTPDPAWSAVGSSRVMWIMLILGGTFLFPIVPILSLPGLVLSIVYLTAVRPKLNRAAAVTDRDSTVS